MQCTTWNCPASPFASCRRGERPHHRLGHLGAQCLAWCERDLTIRDVHATRSATTPRNPERRAAAGFVARTMHCLKVLHAAPQPHTGRRSAARRSTPPAAPRAQHRTRKHGPRRSRRAIPHRKHRFPAGPGGQYRTAYRKHHSPAGPEERSTAPKHRSPQHERHRSTQSQHAAPQHAVAARSTAVRRVFLHEEHHATRPSDHLPRNGPERSAQRPDPGAGGPEVFDGVVGCKVVVEEPHRHHRTGRQFHVRVDVSVPGRDIVVSNDPGDAKAHEDAYVAVADAFDAAHRQLLTYADHRTEAAVAARPPLRASAPGECAPRGRA